MNILILNFESTMCSIGRFEALWRALEYSSKEKVESLLRDSGYLKALREGLSIFKSAGGAPAIEQIENDKNISATDKVLITRFSALMNLDEQQAKSTTEAFFGSQLKKMVQKDQFESEAESNKSEQLLDILTFFCADKLYLLRSIELVLSLENSNRADLGVSSKSRRRSSYFAARKIAQIAASAKQKSRSQLTNDLGLALAASSRANAAVTVHPVVRPVTSFAETRDREALQALEKILLPAQSFNCLPCRRYCCLQTNRICCRAPPANPHQNTFFARFYVI